MLKFLASLISDEQKIKIAFVIARKAIGAIKNEAIRETLLQLILFVEPVIQKAIEGSPEQAEVVFNKTNSILAQAGLLAQIDILEGQEKRGFEVSDKIKGLHAILNEKKNNSQA